MMIGRKRERGRKKERKREVGVLSGGTVLYSSFDITEYLQLYYHLPHN